MPFQRVAIWGLGLMGGSLAAALRAKGFTGRIAGISSPSSIARALESDFIDQGYEHQAFADGLEGADLIVLASPIGSIIENLGKLAAVAPPGCIVTDIGSTKSAIVKAASALPSGVTFIGGHPMTGSEASGIAAADAYLYENTVWVLTPPEGCPDAPVAELAAFAESVGAKVVVTDPEMHDRIVARISHLPQSIAITLMNRAGRWNEEEDLTLRMAAGGFRSLTRIASSPWEMWQDIYGTNKEAILEAIDGFRDELDGLRERISDGGVSEDFERANRLRLSVPRDTRGFVRPLTDILVVVQDEPGVLARIAGCLAPQGINIRDLEVLKVREGEGGTMRLSFQENEDARRAVKLLADAGFRSWVRE